VAFSIPLAAERLPGHADLVADYRIGVRLDAATHRLEGKERVTWRNPSDEAVRDLWLHLYLNGFKNSLSTFYRESGGRLRGDSMREDSWGWIDVSSMRLADGRPLAPSFEHPDDDNADDRTVVRVALPEPVGPGASVTLDVDFRAQLPRIFARTGYAHDFHLVGQWFPKLAVYEPAGMRGRAAGGWNAHQFHANSEFYADYGHYRVDFTVPARFVVGATGRRVNRQANADGTVTYTYEQADVHDFAWTADPGFVEVKRMFSASADVSPAEYAETARLVGRTLDDVRLSDVEMVFLMQPGHLPQIERHVAAARTALKWFGLLYGRYPYPTLTMVDPAVGAEGALGMEYPTFVTGGAWFPFQHWPLEHVRLSELILIHEVGHQWFYGLVGSNEFEEAWLDEGFTSYGEVVARERGWGAGAAIFEALGLRLGNLEENRLGNNPERVFDAIRRPAWRYSSSNQYGFNSYARAALTLETLRGIVGEEAMARVMRTYAERFRFRHPSSDDFYAVASEVSGRDLRPFFEQTVERPGVVDYEVASVDTRRLPEPQGLVEGNGKPLTVSAEEAARREKEADRAKTRLWESTVLVRRRGEVVLPVEVELRFEGGARDRRAWDGQDRWIRYRVTRPERLLSAHVDPDGKLALDVDALNNAKRVAPDGRASAQWAGRALFWVQQILAFVGM
jgi:hypothetical protein